MVSNFVKVTLLMVTLLLVVVLVGRATPTFADSPQFAPPTVALPTPAVTRTPVSATPVAPVAPVRAAATATRAPANPFSPKTLTTKALGTNFTLVNMSSTAANVTVSYYKTDGSTWTAAPANTGPFSIAANYGQKIIRQYTDGTLTSGSGSVVVASDQPLGAVVQVLAPGQTATSGAYIGFSTTNQTFNVPLVFRQLTTASGVANSQLAIQNAGSSATTVSVQFLGSTNYTKPSISIPVGATYYYDLSGETNLTAPWFGSAIVTAASGGQIAVVAQNFLGADTLHTYNGFSPANVGTGWFVPLFTSRLANGLSTPVTIQNLSGGSIASGAVTLSCTPDAGSSGLSPFSKTNSSAIPNNASFSWNPVTDLSIPALWYGSCNINSPGNIVAFSQMRFIGTANEDAYQAINANGTNKTVVVPLVAKILGNGFATAVTIQNLSLSSVAHVTLTYTPSPDYVASGGSASVLSTSTTIAAGKSLIQNQRLSGFTVGATPMPNGWFGTLAVTSSDQAIDGFVQLSNVNGVAGDTFMTHNVFTLP